MMDDRRRDPREDTSMSVKCWIMDRSYSPILAEHIPASCLNISAGGMELEWPQWWKCKGCPYRQNDSCARTTCPFDETNKFLVSETLLRVFVDDRKVEHFARVVWIRKHEECCRIGLSFAVPEAEA